MEIRKERREGRKCEMVYPDVWGGGEVIGHFIAKKSLLGAIGKWEWGKALQVSFY